LFESTIIVLLLLVGALGGEEAFSMAAAIDLAIGLDVAIKG
jgi:hypothetical protein